SGNFGRNLAGLFDNVTNDRHMGVFGGNAGVSKIRQATFYHALSDHTRAAAAELGWHRAEAQAAIWTFTKTLRNLFASDKSLTPENTLFEKDLFGSKYRPEVMETYAQDFSDIMR